QTRAARAVDNLEQGRAALAAKTTHAQGFPSGLDADLTAAIKTEQDAGERVGALRGEHTRLTASVRALQASTDPICPTCATALADPAALLASLQAVQADVAANGALAATAQTAAATTVADLNRAVSTRALALAAVGHVNEQLIPASQHVVDTAAEVTAALATVTAARVALDLAVDTTKTATANLPSLRATTTAAQAVLRNAESAALAAGRVPALQALHTEATALLTAATARMATAQAGTEGMTSPDAALTEAAGTAATARATAKTLNTTASELGAAYKVQAERVVGAERLRDMEQARFNARAAALGDYEAKTATRETLDAFRRDRIARLAPEMSEVATDFVAKMTDGKFTSVELDEEFTPILTDDTGQERPAAWLSGGEESAVALALRVAIGEIIAGQRGGVLFLDEVLTAQDPDRRAAMMSSIRELPGRQTITINHVSEAADMVDLVLEVVPNELDGSTVRVSGSTAVTGVMPAAGTIMGNPDDTHDHDHDMDLPVAS
ncbi:MAG: ATP-binding protein, partial [Propionicimonas sp.]